MEEYTAEMLVTLLREDDSITVLWGASSEGRIPEAWIGRGVMLETAENVSSDLRAAAPSTWRTSTSGASSL